jgi:hypothetical protein
MTVWGMTPKPNAAAAVVPPSRDSMDPTMDGVVVEERVERAGRRRSRSIRRSSQVQHGQQPPCKRDVCVFPHPAAAAPGVCKYRVGTVLDEAPRGGRDATAMGASTAPAARAAACRRLVLVASTTNDDDNEVVVMGERISGRGEAGRAASEYRHEHRRTPRPPPSQSPRLWAENVT